MDKKVSIFIISNNKNVLLLKTNSKLCNPSYWSIVNGGVDNGETFENCAKREVKEETGLNLDRIIDTGYIFKYEYPKGNLREKRIFIGFVNTESIKLSNEHEDFKWVSLKKLPNEFQWTETKGRIQEIINKINFLF